MENGKRTVSAVATIDQGTGSVSGSIVTYSNDPTNPEGFGSFGREMENMFESNETIRDHDPEGFADFDPVPANLERNRKRDRDELERNREFVRNGTPNLIVVDHSGKPLNRVIDPERDGIHNRTYSATIGIGNRSVSEIAEIVFGSLGSGYGFQVREQLGYWEGKPERSVSIVFQGTESRFRRILRTLAISLPNERFAHIEITKPEIEYSDFDSLRDQVRETWNQRLALRADPGIGCYLEPEVSGS